MNFFQRTYIKEIGRIYRKCARDRGYVFSYVTRFWNNEDDEVICE